MNVIVTGAGGGLGRAVVERLLAVGWACVGVDRPGGRPADLPGHPALTWVDADLTAAADVDALRDRLDELDAVDALVNNAGVFEVGGVLDIDVARWRRVFEVNVEGTLRMTQAVAPLLLRGLEADPDAVKRIVNVGSGASVPGRSAMPAYGASKAALDHLTASTAAELGPRGVAVTAVYPGDVDGGMWDRLPAELAAASGEAPDDVRARRTGTVPRGRFQQPAEFAEVLVNVLRAPAMAFHGSVVWSDAHAARLL